VTRSRLERLGEPLVIGLAGGIGSGKSTVARMLAEQGARVIHADRLAHAVLDEPAVRRRIVERWGEEVLDDDGRVCRRRLAAKVFAEESELKRLEALIHPRVKERVRWRLAEATGEETVVVDAPLLFEATLADLCQAVVFVEAPETLRRRRVVEDRGWSEAEWRLREARQMPLHVKRSRATHAISNAGTREELRRRVAALFRSLVQEHSQPATRPQR